MAKSLGTRYTFSGSTCLHFVNKSFKEWTTGAPTDEAVICTVDTSRAALDLVAAGIGITFIPNECVENQPGVQYVPLKNWHQALYMCILYDKWLEPPVWDFIENVVKGFRAKKHLPHCESVPVPYKSPEAIIASGLFVLGDVLFNSIAHPKFTRKSLMYKQSKKFVIFYSDIQSPFCCDNQKGQLLENQARIG